MPLILPFVLLLIFLFVLLFVALLILPFVLPGFTRRGFARQVLLRQARRTHIWLPWSDEFTGQMSFSAKRWRKQRATSDWDNAICQ
ncbi:MAG: hypothetical protein ACYDCD_04825 [Candidatus Acidiferrales bacterium]